jgi:hypothetical protein
VSTASERNKFDDIIARHGLGVTGVVPELPEAAHWAHTVGFHAAGLPELILFGEDAGVASHVLSEVGHDLRTGTAEPRPGTEIPGMLGPEADLPVRLGEVRPEWADRFAPLAGWYHRVAPDEVPFLQVVVPDLAGRFADDPGYDDWSVELQPDLSRPRRPWLGPLVPRHDRRDGPPVEALAPVPILSSVDPEDRDELVPVRRDDDGRWVVSRPAVLASTVTVGTVLDLPPDVVPTGPRDGLDVLPAAEVAERGWWRSLHFRITDACGAHGGDLRDTVRATLAGFEPDVAVSFGRASVHVDTNPALARRLRLALRPLVRDGHLREIEPYDRATCHAGCDCYG